jgi:predicted double-glycine peptidase
MNLWLGAVSALVCALAGLGLGWWFSRLRGPYWLLGYFIPLAVILIYAVAIRFPGWSLPPPISWLILGRKKFAVLGLVAALVLMTPLSRLPQKRDRLVVLILLVAMVFSMSVWPFLAPMFNRNQLSNLKTRIDPDGICLQNTDYTCGPAAAVTALRQLGLVGEEGQIAIASYTSSETGTPPDILAEALQIRYAKDGLNAEYRTFKSIADLKQAGLTLAVVKFGFMVDHWVAVLQVTDSQVVIGDPLNGLDKMTHEDFLQIWRFEGVVLKRRTESGAN